MKYILLSVIMFVSICSFSQNEDELVCFNGTTFGMSKAEFKGVLPDKVQQIANVDWELLPEFNGDKLGKLVLLTDSVYNIAFFESALEVMQDAEDVIASKYGEGHVGYVIKRRGNMKPGEWKQARVWTIGKKKIYVGMARLDKYQYQPFITILNHNFYDPEQSEEEINNAAEKF